MAYKLLDIEVEWITGAEVERMLHISTSTVRNYTKEKRLNPARMGKRSLRYDKAEVMSLLMPANTDDTGVVPDALVPHQFKPKKQEKKQEVFSAKENLARA